MGHPYSSSQSELQGLFLPPSPVNVPGEEAGAQLQPALCCGVALVLSPALLTHTTGPTALGQEGSAEQ